MSAIISPCGLSDLTTGLAGDAEKEQNRCIVRLRTTTWADSKGLHIKRSLTYLRRQCVGFNGLAEDAIAGGAEQAIASITNLNQCQDGIYEAVVCNVSHDWETGYADDWDYKLVPIATP
jgi:hypothetical protein